MAVAADWQVIYGASLVRSSANVEEACHQIVETTPGRQEKRRETLFVPSVAHLKKLRECRVIRDGNSEVELSRICEGCGPSENQLGRLSGMSELSVGNLGGGRHLRGSLHESSKDLRSAAGTAGKWLNSSEAAGQVDGVGDRSQPLIIGAVEATTEMRVGGPARLREGGHVGGRLGGLSDHEKDLDRQTRHFGDGWD